MYKIKKFYQFFEDANSTGSSTAGMGAVSSPGVSGLPGVPGTPGSGDLSFYLLSKRGKKVKKGNPSEVSDMRFLEPAKGITKVKESYRLSDDENGIINDCLMELIDSGFELNQLAYDDEQGEYDIDVDNDIYGTIKMEQIRISLFQQFQKVWRGNLQLRYEFNKSEVTKKRISTLRPDSELDNWESEIVELSEDACLRLINLLNYYSGVLTCDFLVAGSGMPFGAERNINVNIHIVLNRITKQ